MVNTRSRARAARRGRGQSESAGADHPDEPVDPSGETVVEESGTSQTESGTSPQDTGGASGTDRSNLETHTGMVRDSSGCLYPRVFTLRALADAMLRAETRCEGRAASPGRDTTGAPNAPSNTAERANVQSMSFGPDAPSPRTRQGVEHVAGHLSESDGSAPRPIVPPARQVSTSDQPQPGPSRATTNTAGPRLHHFREPASVETGVPKISKLKLMKCGPSSLAKYKRAIKEGKLRVGDRLGCLELTDQFKASLTITAAEKNAQQQSAAGSAGSTLRHASSLYRAERMSVQFVDAQFNPVPGAEADGLTWQVKSRGVLGTPGVDTTSVDFADATLIGVSWDTRVRVSAAPVPRSRRQRDDSAAGLGADRTFSGAIVSLLRAGRAIVQARRGPLHC